MIYLYKAMPEHGPMLVKWRNDNREWFDDTEPVTMKSHNKWWHGDYVLMPNSQIFMVGLEGYGPIGTVSLTVEHGRGEIGRMILGDKMYARQGFMQDAVRQMMKAYGLEWYWLYTKRENIPTQKFFTGIGFRTLPYDLTVDAHVRMEYRYRPGFPG